MKASCGTRVADCMNRVEVNGQTEWKWKSISSLNLNVAQQNLLETILKDQQVFTHGRE